MFCHQLACGPCIFPGAGKRTTVQNKGKRWCWKPGILRIFIDSPHLYLSEIRRNWWSLSRKDTLPTKNQGRLSKLLTHPCEHKGPGSKEVTRGAIVACQGEKEHLHYSHTKSGCKRSNLVFMRVILHYVFLVPLDLPDHSLIHFILQIIFLTFQEIKSIILADFHLNLLTSSIYVKHPPP